MHACVNNEHCLELPCPYQQLCVMYTEQSTVPREDFGSGPPVINSEDYCSQNLKPSWCLLPAACTWQERALLHETQRMHGACAPLFALKQIFRSRDERLQRSPTAQQLCGTPAGRLGSCSVLTHLR